MSAPKRIQLRRTKGWRKPAGAVVVSRPSVFGNPFILEAFMGGWSVDSPGRHHDVYETKTAAAACAVELYAALMDERLHRNYDLDVWHARLDKLAGHDVACWCGLDVPCHGDVLLELANGARP